MLVQSLRKKNNERNAFQKNIKKIRRNNSCFNIKNWHEKVFNSKIYNNNSYQHSPLILKNPHNNKQFNNNKNSIRIDFSKRSMFKSLNDAMKKMDIDFKNINNKMDDCYSKVKEVFESCIKKEFSEYKENS